MNPFFLKRLWRRPWLSLCSLIISGTLCFLLAYMTGYLDEQEQQLAQVKDSFRILCVVTNRSGTQSTGLRMTPMETNTITGEDSPLAPYMDDLRLTKEFLGRDFRLGLDNDLLLGVTNPRCSEKLDPEMGATVTLWQEDFWVREDKVCLISQECYERLFPPEDGQQTVEPVPQDISLEVIVQDPYMIGSDSDLGSGQVTLTVAGVYAGSGNTIFLPFAAASNLSVELSERITCDSAAFLVRDNRELSALAQAASQDFGAVDPTAGDGGTPRLALTIHDEVYRSTIATLEQNIRRGELTLPLLLLLCLVCGLLTGFLGTRSEIRSYALMRTLGSTWQKMLVSMVAEQNLLPLLTVSAVAAVMKTPGAALLCLFFQLAGCVPPTIKAVRTPPTAILREQE